MVLTPSVARLQALCEVPYAPCNFEFRPSKLFGAIWIPADEMGPRSIVIPREATQSDLSLKDDAQLRMPGEASSAID